MKKYETPEIELLEYEVEDCLTGSTDIPDETESLNDFIGDLT